MDGGHVAGELAKGWCALCVIFIHSGLGVGTAFHDYVVNRAVGVFLVMYGSTSERWFAAAERRGTSRAATLEAWYRGRLTGLLPSWWLSLATSYATGVAQKMTYLWTLDTDSDQLFRPPQQRLASPNRLLGALGYAPFLGTSWFVTEILMQTALFPALRATMLRLARQVAAPAPATSDPPTAAAAPALPPATLYWSAVLLAATSFVSQLNYQVRDSLESLNSLSAGR